MALEIWHDTFASEARLADGAVSSLMEGLRSLRLPPFIKVAGIGIDGTGYGIEVPSFMAGVKLSWWGEAPEEWDALRSWYRGAVSMLEAQLPTSVTPLQAMHPWVE